MACSDWANLLFIATAGDFRDHVLEFRDVLEAAIDRSEADVGDFVEPFQFFHDAFTNALRADLALAHRENFLFDAADGGVDRFGRNWSFAQCQHQAGAQFGGGEFDSAAIFLDDDRHREFDALISGEAFVAFDAAAATADGVALFRCAGVEDLGVFVVAERTFHDGFGSKELAVGWVSSFIA